MNREELEGIIQDAALGRADEEAAALLEREAERDSDLRAERDFAFALKREAERAARVEAGPEFTARVMAAVRARAKRPRRVLSADFLAMSGRFAISVAVHAAILLLLAFVVLQPGRGPELPSVVDVAGLYGKAVAERREAPKFRVSLSDGWLDLSGISAGTTLYVLRGRAEGYHVLLAYTSEQVAKLSPDLADGAIPFPVRNGRIRLSQGLVAEGLGGASEVVLLALADRFEIWNARDFDSFISRGGASPPAAML